MNHHDESELTPRETDAYSRLARESEPPPALEERIVGALRNEGLLRSRFAPSVRVSWPLALAAGLVLFAAGMVAGRVLAPRPQVGGADAVVATPASPAPGGGIRVVISM
jgi:hypothetical protein